MTVKVEPLSKGHFGISHFVLCREVVLFLAVKNAMGKGPKRASFIGRLLSFWSLVPLYINLKDFYTLSFIESLPFC